MEQLLGIYDRENFTLLNVIECNKEDDEKTSIHETIHFMLTLQTKWGIFEYAMNHIERLIEPEYTYISQLVHEKTLLIQECVAELWELLYIADKYGEEKLSEHLAVLKFKNPTSYSYIKVIQPILEKRFSYNVDHLAFVVYITALFSLDGPLEDINAEIWSNDKDINDFLFKNQDQYVPSIIFENKIKELNRFLIDEKLEEYLKQFDTKWLSNDLNIRQMCLIELKTFLYKLTTHSKHKDEIQDYIKTINPKEIELSQIQETIIPVSFHHYDLEVSHSEMPLLKDKLNALFICGNKSDLTYTFKSKFHEIDLTPWKSEKDYFVPIYLLEEKKIYIRVCSECRLQKYIKKYWGSKIVSYKAYENNNKLKKIINYTNTRYFVYCDRPYLTAKITINEFCKRKSYIVIDFDKFKVLCFELDGKGILLVPIVNVNEANFYYDMQNGYFGKDCVINDRLFSTAREKEELNVVINCMFEL